MCQQYDGLDRAGTMMFAVRVVRLEDSGDTRPDGSRIYRVMPSAVPSTEATFTWTVGRFAAPAALTT